MSEFYLIYLCGLCICYEICIEESSFVLGAFSCGSAGGWRLLTQHSIVAQRR